MKNDPKKKKIVIVGGGVAGLAAGIYGRKAGFETLVLERHSMPGGLCTAWEKNGYTIDGCVHFIMGSGPGSALHSMWKELDVFQELDPAGDFIYHKDFFHFRFENGTRIDLTANLDVLQEDLISRFPEDAGQVKRFVNAVKSLRGFEPPLDVLKGWVNLFRAARSSWKYVPAILKWKNTSIRDFAYQFKSRELRESFIRLWYPEYNMLYILLLLDWLRRGLAGYPLRNSLGFSRVLEKAYRNLDGEIRYRSKVSNINTERGRAVSATLDSGEIIAGDRFINTAASPWTMKQLLGRDHLAEKDYPVTPPLVHICFGSSYNFSAYTSSACGLQIELDPPVVFAGEQHEFLLLHIYNFASGLAPEGKTLVKAIFPTTFDYWDRLKQSGDENYKEEKVKAVKAVLEAVDRYFPGFTASVEMTDVATPVTFYRFTGNQEGSLIAWGAVPGTPMMLKKKVPGIGNLHLAGHWVMPGGGVPQAALSARHAVQAICMEEGKAFSIA